MKTFYSRKFARFMGSILAKATWDPDLHPRSEGGKFSRTEGVSEERRVAERLMGTSADQLEAEARETEREASALRAMGKGEKAAMADAVARDLMERAKLAREPVRVFRPGSEPRRPAPPIDPTRHPQESVRGRAETMRKASGKPEAFIMNTRRVMGGKGECHRVLFDDGTRAAYKPTAGSVLVQMEKQGRGEEITIDPKIPESKRERAVFDLSAMAGFDVVPPVELVDYDGVGSPGGGHAMAWVDGQEAIDIEDQYYKDISANHPDLHRIAALDFITGNVDRHQGNFMRGKDGRWYAIDNGLCFTRDMELGMSWSDVMRKLMMHVTPPEVRAEIASIDKDAMGGIMKEAGFDAVDIKAAQTRLDVLKALGGWGTEGQMYGAAEDAYFQAGGRRRPGRE
jgi:hypothetical protein